MLDSRLIDRIERLLDVLDTSIVVQDMDYGGNYLHKLKGTLGDVWSVRVSGNWRLTFRFNNGNAYDVNLEDYH